MEEQRPLFGEPGEPVELPLLQVLEDERGGEEKLQASARRRLAVVHTGCGPPVQALLLADRQRPEGLPQAALEVELGKIGRRGDSEDVEHLRAIQQEGNRIRIGGFRPVAAPCFAGMEGPAYIRPRMRNSVKTTFSWVVALGLVLIHVSPVSAAGLVCFEDRARPDCCERTSVAESRTASAEQFLDGYDCACCVAVQIMARTAHTTTLKVAVDDSPEASVVRKTVSSPVVRIAPGGRDVSGNPQLSSIRTVVLLI